MEPPKKTKKQKNGVFSFIKREVINSITIDKNSNLTTRIGFSLLSKDGSKRRFCYFPDHKGSVKFFMFHNIENVTANSCAALHVKTMTPYKFLNFITVDLLGLRVPTLNELNIMSILIINLFDQKVKHLKDMYGKDGTKNGTFEFVDNFDEFPFFFPEVVGKCTFQLNN